MDVALSIPFDGISRWTFEILGVLCEEEVISIASTQSKFQIPDLTDRGHCISGTAVPSANDATP